MSERKALHDDYRTLLKFRKDNPEFFTKDATVSLKIGSANWAAGRTISITSGQKSFVLVGNFGTSASSISVSFPSDGTWTNYLDSKESYSGSSASLEMGAAEWKIFIKQ